MTGRNLRRTSGNSPSQYRSTRIQCLARPRAACSAPTVEMLFSAWQAVTHAPHPVQRSRSTAIPQFGITVRAPGVREIRRRTESSARLRRRRISRTPGARTVMPNWGMAVDLDRCTGCGACVTACHAENNISTVGAEQAARGRAKHWIRVERYWEGDFPDVTLKFRPVMCQHCDNAPCEPVCPTYASHHTPDGLNAQVYNRCIGTRYCANACPYNVRFFDFFNPSWDKPLHLQLNPDVSLREVGVMEKCTFCVQRIKATTIQAKAEDRPVADGEIKPACAQACPAQALVFGDLDDPESAVSQLSRSPRGSKLLEDLGTKPKVAYLSKDA